MQEDTILKIRKSQNELSKIKAEDHFPKSLLSVPKTWQEVLCLLER